MVWSVGADLRKRTTVVLAVAALSVPGREAPAQPPVQCTSCHATHGTELQRSVHSRLKCQECHGGPPSYALAPDELRSIVDAMTAGSRTVRFDHGADYKGRATRSQVPERCGTCHADVQRMNPFGLRTDQLAAYWTSGHGRTLKEKDDTRVAVCTDCHGAHDILPARDPSSRTYPLNVPATCSRCHEDKKTMEPFELPVSVVEEYRQSVHGKLLLEHKDTGSPTCATCHGNHAAAPPGFATVGQVCGQCHEHASRNFATSVHATQTEHKGCVQCHGGGEGRHFHLIEKITKPPGVLIQRYAHLLTTVPAPTPEQITEAIHPDPKAIISRALPTCEACHESIEDDKSLPKLFELLNAIAEAERYYVATATRLDELEHGVLLVHNQRFKFEEAKTHLIELAPLQHTLSNEKVAAAVSQLNETCNAVNTELDSLQNGLRLRYASLLPIWLFAAVFAVALYAKYKRLKAVHVRTSEVGP